MKVRLIINTFVGKGVDPGWFTNDGHAERVEVWKGDIDIKEDNVYLMKISLLADGEPHPIVDVPFSVGLGWWEWHPGSSPEELADVEEMDVVSAYPPEVVQEALSAMGKLTMNAEYGKNEGEKDG